MVPKQASVGIGLMIPFAVYTLEGVRARLILFSFKMRWVNLEVCFAILSKMTMMFSFV